MANAKRPHLTSVTRTAAAQVHEAIKQRILDGYYQSHDYVRETSIARELNVSRTPVREALRELVSEGWLEAIPHHGARVAAWTEKDAHEVFELRLVLEPMAVNQACQHIDHRQLTALDELATRMERLTEQVERHPQARNEIANLNHEFHRQLVQACHNQRLISVLDSVVRTSVIRRNFTNYNITHLLRSMHHHREILQALEANSPSWAENVMRSHLLAARDLHTRFPDTISPPTD